MTSRADIISQLAEVCVDGSCIKKAIPGQRRCKKCQERSTRRQREGRRKYLYGITLQQFFALIEAQNYCCKLCGKKFVGVEGITRHSPTLDHDHKTGKIRGILHRSCNSGLGYFDDDAEKLRQAAQYLEKSKA